MHAETSMKTVLTKQFPTYLHKSGILNSSIFSQRDHRTMTRVDLSKAPACLWPDTVSREATVFNSLSSGGFLHDLGGHGRREIDLPKFRTDHANGSTQLHKLHHRIWAIQKPDLRRLSILFTPNLDQSSVSAGA